MKKDELSQPQTCFTAAGCLIHQKKVLMVQHKKLGIWVNPGGHIEDNELPHQAAEREFWEETGLRVEAYDPFQLSVEDDDNSQFLPSPFSSNVHWISRDNYNKRVRGAAETPESKIWSKGCEQHLNFLYLVRPTGSLDYEQNVEEVSQIGWFTQDEVVALPTSPNIIQEVVRAFELVN